MTAQINKRVLREHFGIRARPEQVVVALAGNPNVVKKYGF